MVYKHSYIRLLHLHKSKYVRRYRGPKGEWVYVYKEGNKTYRASFDDIGVEDLIERTARKILFDGKRNGFDAKKSLQMASDAVSGERAMTPEQKSTVAVSIVKRAMKMWEDEREESQSGEE